MTTESGSQADAKAWAAFEAWALEHGFIAVRPEDWDKEDDGSDTDITVVARTRAGQKEQPAG